MPTLHNLIIRMGRTIRDLDYEGDNIELWANDAGGPSEPEYVPEVEQAGGLARLVADVLVSAAVSLADCGDDEDPGEFFKNPEYARGQVELISRTMEALGVAGPGDERRWRIAAELAAQTNSTQGEE